VSINRKESQFKASRIVVAGGAGVGSKENFRLVWDLANALGGAPGATRALLIGIHRPRPSGRPDRYNSSSEFYIAIGLSGAIQHQAGMSDSQKIIAINNDPTAPIFDVRIQDCRRLNDVVPKMIKAIKARV
jgi:electron transfer flavoprotein alpha subunit